MTSRSATTERRRALPGSLPSTTAGGRPGSRFYSHGWEPAAGHVALKAPAGVDSRRGWLRLGVRPYLLLVDMAALVVASVVSPWGRPLNDLLLGGVMVALYQARGLYRSRLSLSVLDDFPALVGRGMSAAAVCAAASLVLPSPGDPISGPTSPVPANGTAVAIDALDALLTGVLLVALVVAARAGVYAVVQRVRVSGRVAHPTLLVGAGRVGVMLARGLAEHREYGLRPVGFLDSSPTVPAHLRPLPVLGGEESLASVIVEHQVHDVVVAFAGLSDSVLVDLVLTCDWLDCEIFVVPRLFELHRASRSTDHVWGVPLVRMRRPAFRSARWKVKRMLDVGVAAAGLVVGAPLLAGLAVAVRLEGGPGVLFRQDRVGRNGRTFSLIKFRSMRPADQTESARRWSISEESRVGPVGRVLRTTSLDELPQLWNVLRGDMSLVGPRPERPYFVSEFTKAHPRYHARLRVPAGMTGWAQVHGLRGDTSIEERVAFDNLYITNWSLWLDLKILVRTVLEVLRRSGS